MRFERDGELAQWLGDLVVTEEVFQWDWGNATKNVKKHGVNRKEIESLFLGSFVLGGKILEPHHIENRWIIFGESGKRRLTLIFTVRDNLIRPISCRPMRKEERKLYEEIIQGQSTH